MIYAFGVSKFTFIFSIKFYKGKNMIKYSDVGKNIVQPNVSLPETNC